MLVRIIIVWMILVTSAVAPTRLRTIELPSMLNPTHTSALIDYVLSAMQKSIPGEGWDSKEAKDMINLTFAQESKWRELRQVTKGGGVGIAHGVGQIEPKTVQSILTRTAHKKYPDYRARIREAIEDICACDLVLIDDPEEEEFLKMQLMSNIALNIALARVKIRNIPKPFPQRKDYSTQDEYIVAMGHLWNNYYNTNEEHGTPSEFLASARYWIRKGGKLSARD